jgi:hypothetical protein
VRKFFKLLIHEVASATGVPKSNLLINWKQRLVVGMRRAAMLDLGQRAQTITNPRIGDIHEEQVPQGIVDIEYVLSTVVSRSTSDFHEISAKSYLDSILALFYMG